MEREEHKVLLRRGTFFAIVVVTAALIASGCDPKPSADEKSRAGRERSKQEEITGKNGSSMVLIPAGEFSMGSPDEEGYNDERPLHKVYLDAYYMDKYEVNNDQYARFLNTYGKDTDDNGNKMIYENSWGVQKKGKTWQAAAGHEKNPVVYVTWYGANQYAKHYGKRLPTEAEWEKACRAGATTKYYFDNNEADLPTYAWYRKNSGNTTHPVGLKRPNGWGIYDILGNVHEWCADWRDPTYYKSSPRKNPQGPPKGTFRVTRGGSWNYFAFGCRCAVRNWSNPNCSYYSVGFRCAANVTGR